MKTLALTPDKLEAIEHDLQDDQAHLAPIYDALRCGVSLLMVPAGVDKAFELPEGPHIVMIETGLGKEQEWIDYVTKHAPNKSTLLVCTVKPEGNA